ncbi:MAG: hypothetical protein L0Y71_13825 [Gemmataceae bacterium]|nr:hypothetical protein [Gemmataceae bacterium]
MRSWFFNWRGVDHGKTTRQHQRGEQADGRAHRRDRRCVGEIKQQLEVKPDTTLKQLAGKTTEVKFLYTELEKKQQNAESLLSDREANEFEKQIEMIKKMVADADEMETEGNE